MTSSCRIMKEVRMCLFDDTRCVLLKKKKESSVSLCCLYLLCHLCLLFFFPYLIVAVILLLRCLHIHYSVDFIILDALSLSLFTSFSSLIQSAVAPNWWRVPNGVLSSREPIRCRDPTTTRRWIGPCPWHSVSRNASSTHDTLWTDSIPSCHTSCTCRR